MANTLRGQLEERWRELDEPVRDALAIAGLQGREFLDELVTAAAQAIGWDEDPALRLPNAETQLHWLRRLDGYYVFQERYLVEIAEREVRELLDADEISEALDVMARRVGQLLGHAAGAWVSLPTPLVLRLMALDVALAQRTGHHRESAAVSAVALARFNADAGALDEAEMYSRDAIRLGSDTPTRTSGAGILAVVLGRQGRVEEELAVLEGERPRLPDGSVDAAILDKQIAEALLSSGRVDEAEAAARRTLEASDPWAQQALTQVLRARGDLDRALTHQRSVVERTEHADGLPPSALADVVFVLAELERETGDAVAAVETARRAAQLAQDAVDVHATLRARELEALAHTDLAEFEIARDLLRDVASEYSGTTGRWASSELAALSELARAEIGCGDPKAAREQLEHLLPRWHDVTGPDHPNVALTEWLILRCQSLLSEPAMMFRAAVNEVRNGRADRVIEVAACLAARADTSEEQRRASSLLAAALWHAGRGAASLKVATETARRDGTARSQAEAERLAEWLSVSGEPESSMDDVELAVRDALLEIARSARRSPLLEMTIIETVRDGLKEIAGREQDSVAAFALMGLTRAASRMSLGYPTFHALQSPAPFTSALAEGARSIVWDSPAIVLLSRLDGALAGELLDDDAPEMVARKASFWLTAAIFSGRESRAVDEAVPHLGWMFIPPT